MLTWNRQNTVSSWTIRPAWSGFNRKTSSIVDRVTDKPCVESQRLLQDTRHEEQAKDHADRLNVHEVGRPPTEAVTGYSDIREMADTM